MLPETQLPIEDSFLRTAVENLLVASSALCFTLSTLYEHSANTASLPSFSDSYILDVTHTATFSDELLFDPDGDRANHFIILNRNKNEVVGILLDLLEYRFHLAQAEPANGPQIP
ncbi:MAG: hypothetical protein V4519_03290 [Patescibacteria group bacterium]